MKREARGLEDYRGLDLVSIQTAAAKLAAIGSEVTEYRLRKWIEEGKLAFLPVGKRKKLVSLADISELIDALKYGGTDGK